MDTTSSQHPTPINEVRTDTLVARYIPGDMAWGSGSILPISAYSSAEQQEALLRAVMDSLEPVTDVEQVYASCTDGRKPVRLLDEKTPAPVREQLVGADIVCAFAAIEALDGTTIEEPVTQRLERAAAFLQQHGIAPGTHLGCGAATYFQAILENILTFSKDPAYMQYVQALLPSGVYDTTIEADILSTIQRKLERHAFEGLSLQTFIDTVTSRGGTHGIAELLDDHRGVHGHVEEQIVRVRASGLAINVARVMEQTGGRSVFGLNEQRMERLLRILSEGNEARYKRAYIALEHFNSAAYGTLARFLPTYTIEVIS
jgi:hypothetical protein